MLSLVYFRNYLRYKVYTKILMPSRSNAVLFCPLQGVIDIIGKKWALLVIYEIGNHGTIRFNELKNELLGITSKSLVNTLDGLLDTKLIEKESFRETPPRVEYRLTKDGNGLYRIIIPLIQWSASRKDAVVKECSCKHKPRNLGV
jgi:DNA-binding HxlR family transcriptional regulator